MCVCWESEQHENHHANGGDAFYTLLTDESEMEVAALELSYENKNPSSDNYNCIHHLHYCAWFGGYTEETQNDLYQGYVYTYPCNRYLVHGFMIYPVISCTMKSIFEVWIR